MLKLFIKPLVHWPGELTKSRKMSPFSASYSQTLDLLERELNALRARTVVVQLAVSESEIANDERLRASARPSHPGVILSFEYLRPTDKRNEQGQPMGVWTPLSFPCDRFTDWKENLRAIALAMEALRKIDRYGVTRSGEQYKGWKALPASGGLETDRAAAQTLCRFANAGDPDVILDSPDAAKSAYRVACANTHPDKEGGDAHQFSAVQIAWQRLKARHRL